MESTYYNLLAPASYGGMSKFKPKGYTKKQVREWLQSQNTHTLHKPTKRRFPRRRVVVYGIEPRFENDLKRIFEGLPRLVCQWNDQSISG
jgi:hypothetical protein